ncbi:DNA photolyase family protein [Reichenbachiella carrageenanivorans]|uniref:DNA photolyase family protein n=1 Tax=Reichenbachiella carrageenanivorans TaxID=2979869 RepID=A0ABY6CUP9_9BACT|nr:deoxyribodipyrimidine photo-lyase [Reichenbachiella carrageenanivorans]UXX77651.1 DNA photolyase family protein [Reichenbachiella carrageenanivorans]
MEIVAFWFRRDLRLEDNTALSHALKTGKKVLPVFIFDDQILEGLPPDDARVTFIYDTLCAMNVELRRFQSQICVRMGNPVLVWQQLLDEFEISAIYINEDYEPYATARDQAVSQLAESKGVPLLRFKDQVVFSPTEIVKADGLPYTIYTPYKNKWLAKYEETKTPELLEIDQTAFLQKTHDWPSLKAIGFVSSQISVRPYDLSSLSDYSTLRDLPAEDATSYLSVHLRFGTVSVRQVIKQLQGSDQVFLSELIWREFFMQILYHFPEVVGRNFKSKYDGIQWRNNHDDFDKWKRGETGYPLVDAGMKQLNQTGYMHNRVRMVVASFLCKHLLIDWRWGEAYFAEKLLDYELASNNGNWQWSAGTGCDASPYFRIFNPTAQLKKFDPKMQYVKKWVMECSSPIVDHAVARDRALRVYKEGLRAN